MTGVQTPVVSNDAIFIVTNNGRCLALDRHTGQEFWDISLPQNHQWLGPVMAGGMIYVLSQKGELRAVDPLSGRCVGTLQLGEKYSFVPIVVRDGLLFLSDHGKLSFYRRVPRTS